MAKLSIEECRKCLIGLDLTDKQIEVIRNELVLIFNNILRGLLKNGRTGTKESSNLCPSIE